MKNLKPLNEGEEKSMMERVDAFESAIVKDVEFSELYEKLCAMYKKKFNAEFTAAEQDTEEFDELCEAYVQRLNDFGPDDYTIANVLWFNY